MPPPPKLDYRLNSDRENVDLLMKNVEKYYGVHIVVQNF